MASKKARNAACRAASTRVIAKPKTSANTASASIAPSAAAAPAGSKTANSRTERPVIRPADAASVVAMMPLTISAKTSGTIVNLSASSHRPPTASAAPATGFSAGQAAQSHAAPSARPAASPAGIRHACVIGPP